MQQPKNAERLATIPTETGKVSYWQHGEEVYRLNEYEPVQFDIYGLPLGARWETNLFHWPSLKAILAVPEVSAGPIDVSTISEYGLTQKLSSYIRVF